MDNEIKRLESLLGEIQLLDTPFRGSGKGKDLYENICKLVFEDQLYVRIWSEPALNRLEQLFQLKNRTRSYFNPN